MLSGEHISLQFPLNTVPGAEDRVNDLAEARVAERVRRLLRDNMMISRLENNAMDGQQLYFIK